MNVTTTQVVLGPNTQTALYSGPITRLNTENQWRITAQLTGPNGGTLNVRIVLQINGQQVTGTIQGLTTNASSGGGESQ